MLTKIDLLFIGLSIIFFFLSYLLHPYTKQYEGITGYVYEYGLVYDVIAMVLVITGCMLLAIPVVHSWWEVEK